VPATAAAPRACRRRRVHGSHRASLPEPSSCWHTGTPFGASTRHAPAFGTSTRPGRPVGPVNHGSARPGRGLPRSARVARPDARALHKRRLPRQTREHALDAHTRRPVPSSEREQPPPGTARGEPWNEIADSTGWSVSDAAVASGRSSSSRMRRPLRTAATRIGRHRRSWIVGFA